MGLSTYMRASKGFYESLDASDYQKIADVLEDIVPLDLGEKHNATRNIEIQIPIATWHKGGSVDNYLWEKAGSPDRDEYVLDLYEDDIKTMIEEARKIQEDPDSVDSYLATYYADYEDDEWIQTQFQRLERALTDYLLDDRLKGWTLTVWRSY